MDKIILIGLLVSAVFGTVCYVSTFNFIVSGVVLVLTLLYFLFVLKKRMNKFNKKIDSFIECFHFINNMIVSLSIKGSITMAYENAMSMADDELQKLNCSIQDLTDNEKILYLKRYFKFSLYQLFTDVVDLWCEEGGNILEMTSFLSNELREEEEYISFTVNENNKRLIEFIVLWLFSIVILFILRFVLSDFYQTIISQAFYPYAVMGFFLLILLSTEIITRKMTKLDLKENENEK